jgi:hypothetical protein
MVLDNMLDLSLSLTLSLCLLGAKFGGGVPSSEVLRPPFPHSSHKRDNSLSAFHCTAARRHIISLPIGICKCQQQQEGKDTSINSMKITPQSESFDIYNDKKEIAAFTALVQLSSLAAAEDDGDGASLVSMVDERLHNVLLVAHDDDNHENDDETLASLDHNNEGGGDWRHNISSIDDNDDGGATISSLDKNDNDYEDANFLLSPIRVRQHARSLLLTNHVIDNDIIMNLTITSRLHSILHKIQNNPLLSVATLFMSALAIFIGTNALSSSSSKNRFTISTRSSDYCNYNVRHKTYPTFPAEALLGITIPDTEKNQSTLIENLVIVKSPYKASDFQHSNMTYWNEVVEAIEQTQRVKGDIDIKKSDSKLVDGLWSNLTTWGPCYPRAITYHTRNHNNLDQNQHLRIERKNRLAHNWTYIVQTFNSYNTSSHDKNVVYPSDRISSKCSSTSVKKNGGGGGGGGGEQPPLGGLCRPSFLIIGQGKCGTSSLYHYLIGHPRILPAKEKQIDYFNYHKYMPLSWYYSHFPTIESFLGNGALMTGEASPGYMPYPSVIEGLVKSSTAGYSGSDIGVEVWKAHVLSLPKIIAIVRNPIERAKSSYKYNYVEPAIEKLRSGSGITVRGKRIPGKRSEQYYRTNHLFSFEDLAYAELEVLKECLKAGGRGEQWTFADFGSHPGTLFYETVRRRSNVTSTSDTPPLIHLDESCYDTTKSKAVPRTQWEVLALEHPNKTLALPNLHLIQSILGRGVYALPLEWWYEVFSHVDDLEKELSQIHVVCTEDLANAPTKTMEDVAKFLGLPEFNFEDITNVGRYNVGGHRGYDTITKFHSDDDEHYGSVISENQASSNHESSSGAPEEEEAADKEEVVVEEDPLLTISDAFLNELVHFYHPYNERLFRLIGRRCPW